MAKGSIREGTRKEISTEVVSEVTSVSDNGMEGVNALAGTGGCQPLGGPTPSAFLGTPGNDPAASCVVHWSGPRRSSGRGGELLSNASFTMHATVCRTLRQARPVGAR